MYYADFGEIIEDGLSGNYYGKDKQIEVLGWCERKGSNKRYIVKCHECCKDAELFGDGLFVTTKSQLIKRGVSPCGCTVSPRWTENQNKIRCERKAAELGFVFTGWSSDYIGDKTKLLMVCPKHGEWDTGVLNHLMNGRGCPGCKGLVTSEFNTRTKKKSEQHFIESFIKTGVFSDETSFTKIDRRDKKGNQNYWRMYCSDCQESGEILASDLQKGRRPCACTPQRQKQAYINGIFDNGTLIALKFGVAVRYEDRLTAQRRKSKYEINNLCVYTFDTAESCRKAEKYCKESLECGVVSKPNMSDGYTETTYIYNYKEITTIFKTLGGVPMEAT